VLNPHQYILECPPVPLLVAKRDNFSYMHTLVVQLYETYNLTIISNEILSKRSAFDKDILKKKIG